MTSYVVIYKRLVADELLAKPRTRGPEEALLGISNRCLIEHAIASVMSDAV
jgi:hypothetical protein